MLRRKSVLALLLSTVLSPALSYAQGAEKCLPVAGNWTWTPDEVLRNEAQVKRILQDPKAHMNPPVAVISMAKYTDCVHWMTDHEAYVFNELLMAHEGLKANKSIFDFLNGSAIDFSTGSIFTGFAGKVGAGSLISKEVKSILDDVVFGGTDEEFAAAAASMFVKFEQANPKESAGQIKERIKDQLKAWGNVREASTLKWMDDTLDKVILGQMANRFTPYAADKAEQIAKAKVIKVEKTFKENRPVLDRVVSGAEKAAASAPESVAGAESPDWPGLNKKYKDIRQAFGDVADEKIRAAATDSALRKRLNLTESDVGALVHEIGRRETLLNGTEQAKQLAKDGSQLAALSTNLGWPEGARVFNELSSAANQYANLMGALAGAALGPPGPMQMVAAANAVFSIGGSLSRVFGGGGSKQDDGLAKALQQIFTALRTISDQLRDLRKEQRDNFEYARRNLEVLIELSANQAFEGVESCRRTNFAYSDWIARTGGTEFRLALTSPVADPSLSLRAKSCYKWMRTTGMLPFNLNGINVLYKQRLAKVAEVAAKYPNQEVEFKNKGFVLAEVTFPQLRALLDATDPTVLLYDRDNLMEPNRPTDDIGKRMALAGHSIGVRWELENYLDQMLSSATVATVVESSLTMKPAAAWLANAGTIEETDQAFGQYASIERELYALLLIALAQERLMAGTHVAEQVDQILAESDRLANAAAMRSCLTTNRYSPDNRATCSVVTSLPYDTDVTECPSVPNKDAASLCARWGTAKFQSMNAAAIAALKAFPTMRQNVLAARLWRIAGRGKLARDWAPRYRLAWDLQSAPSDLGKDAGAIALEQLFSGVEVMKLADHAVLNKQNDPFVQDGVYFARLAGQCQDIKERVLLQVASCDGVKCSHSLGKDDQGQDQIIEAVTGKPAKDLGENKEACIMGAMPTPELFASGSLLTTVAASRLSELSAHLSMSLAFDQVFQTMNNDDRATLLRNYRPAFFSQSQK